MPHSGAASEHPWTDKGQIILFIVFLAVWVLDSFVFHYTTFLAKYVPLYIRLYFAGIILVAGVYMAQKAHVVFDKPEGSPNIMTTGIYKLVRHPMYYGGLLLVKGLAVSTLSIASFVLLFVVFIFYNHVSAYEERLLEEKYGDEYREYKKKTGKWVPKLW